MKTQSIMNLGHIDDSEVTRLLIEQIENPDHEWSLQGMGMFRLYLSKEWRLHIWDERFKTPDVTMLHDHPWDFTSRVICGRIENRVMIKAHPEPLYPFPSPFNRPKDFLLTHDERTIQCGPGGGLCDQKTESCRLVIEHSKNYRRGDHYDERASEIHETIYQTGTITLVKRTFKADTEHAHVYPPHGQPWVSAEPRKAEQWEVAQALSTALLVLMSESF